MSSKNSSKLITSILGFVFARSTFSCAYYIAFILVGAILLYFNINNYNKDKYKVAIKKNNFKNSIFYSILIFIIIVIMLVCLNILFGMNFSNLNHFVNLLLFEGLVSLNIVLFPILKLLLITNNKFSVV